MHDRSRSPFPLCVRSQWALSALSVLGLLGGGGTAHAQGIGGDLLSPLTWRSIGPTATGGRIVDIEVDLARKSTLFVASASGGLWRSRNMGTTWECIFQNEGSSSIGDIALDPKNSDVIWIGSGEANNQRSAYWGDGIYKTTDGGKTWTNTGLHDSHHIGRVVVDPTNSDVVWVAAMGHEYTTNDQRGLYKTEDGGRNWKRKLFISNAVGVTDVVLHPRDRNILYAASYERLRRAWNFDGAGPGSAIWRSKDGGESWQRLRDGLPDGEIGRIGLAVTASAPDVVYATVSNQNLEAEQEEGDEAEEEDAEAKARVEVKGDVAKDDDKETKAKGDADAEDPAADEERKPARLGLRGRTIEGAIEITEVMEGEAAANSGLRVADRIVAVDGAEVSGLAALLKIIKGHAEGDTVPFKIRRGSGDDVEEIVIEVTFGTKKVEVVAEEPRRPPGPIGGEIYRSNDAGGTWAKTNKDPVGGNPAYYYGQIRVDPSDADRVWVLSVPVYVSKDGGKTFASNGASSLHVDHHALWIDPEDGDHLVLGNDGGLGITWDGGAAWDHVNNLPIAQFYTVAIDQQTPYRVAGGTQDNGSWLGPSQTGSFRGATHLEWSRIGGGDGFYVQIDPEEGAWAMVESQFGALQRIDLRTFGTSSVAPRAARGEAALRFNWSSPILMSSHSPSLIYFGSQFLHKSYDRGDHWHLASGDLTTNDSEKVAGNVPHCTLTTIAESRFDPDRLLIGTDDGNVQWSDDAGHTWRNHAGRFPGLPPHLWVSRVEFSQHAQETAYATFTGYREDHFTPYVYRTQDAGETWHSIAGNLPPGPVNVLREDPTTQDVLYVGTEFGVLASTDGGTRWVGLDGGLPTVPVHDLVVHPREGDLVIGTHGRGFYILDHNPLPYLTAKALAEPAALMQIRDVRRNTQAGGGRSGSPGSTGASGDRIWRSEEPPRGAVIWYHLRESVEKGALTIEVLDDRDEVIRTLDVKEDRGLHTIEWDLRKAAEEDDAANEGGGGNRRRGRGRPTVGDGTYKVRLRVGELEATQTLRVVQASAG